MKSGVVMMDRAAEPGRYYLIPNILPTVKYYPIPNPLPTVSEKEFFIWTNSTVIQSEW